jgi:hypothetical protein
VLLSSFKVGSGLEILENLLKFFVNFYIFEPVSGRTSEGVCFDL